MLMYMFIWTGALATIIGAIIGRAYERNKWQERLLNRTGLLPEEPRRLTNALDEMRSARNLEPRELAQAIDAIAVEVERIGEGQRFLTKLLADRESRSGGRPGSSPVPGAVRSPIPPAS